MARVVSVGTRRVVPLADGWRLAATPPGAAHDPAGLDAIAPEWLPASVPGTVAQALRDAGRWRLDDPTPLHGQDFWYRASFAAEGEGRQTLRFGGLATLAEAWLNGRPLLRSDNMFLAHEVEADLAAAGENRLDLCFRALQPALAVARTGGGRARWRPRLATPGSLRSVRTTLLGHMPGWCPPVHAVGPWRPVERVEDGGPLRVLDADLRATLAEDGRGRLVLRLAVDWSGPPGAPGRLELEGGHAAPLAWTGPGALEGRLEVAGVEPWWPHTHGRPALHAVRAEVGGIGVDLGRVGFRRIERDDGPDGRGFALRINGERVFCRGACWSVADVVGLPGHREAYAPWVGLARDAGMNMVRVGGTMVYEADAFFGLCDELGLLVWQDFMLASFDYPAGDEAFRRSVALEAGQFLDRTQASPSLAVLCGGSEVEQQAAMLGLPRAAWGGPLFSELLPAAVAARRPDVLYVPNSPSGGELPFVAAAGVAHYYGVGAYLRPLEDARRAGVRFASECLAFANVPEPLSLDRALPGVPAVHHPRWKERVPRDPGASWDFEDVRDHYLALLYGVDPPRLRREEPERYLDLSRAVTAEVMEAVFGEWRRARSTCAGGLVWLLQDPWPGAGWGVVDALGAPKAAWHGLARAFRPVQVTLSDEGVNGLAVHVLNETPREVAVVLSLACLRGGEVPVAGASRELTVPARGALELPVATLLGAFFDAGYAYRFGPPQHDAVVATLADAATGLRLADAFHFPLGRGTGRRELGLEAAAERDGDGAWSLRLRTRRLAQSVHVEDDRSFRAAEAWFHLAPGADRVVRLLPRDRSGTATATAAVPRGRVHALNGLAAAPYGGRP